jgi:hypothetical protein
MGDCEVPLFAAGERIDPPMSVPTPKHDPRNPIRAPSPPLEPPDVNVVLKGLVVTLPKVSIYTHHLCCHATSNLPVYIIARLQMHQSLWLRSSCIKNRTSLPKYLQNIRIRIRNGPNPGHKSPIQVQAFHANMFLHTDRDAVQRPHWLAMFLEIFVEGGRARQGSFWQEFGNAVCLGGSLGRFLRRTREPYNLLCQCCSAEEGFCNCN